MLLAWLCLLSLLLLRGCTAAAATLWLYYRCCYCVVVLPLLLLLLLRVCTAAAAAAAACLYYRCCCCCCCVVASALTAAVHCLVGLLLHFAIGTIFLKHCANLSSAAVLAWVCYHFDCCYRYIARQHQSTAASTVLPSYLIMASMFLKALCLSRYAAAWAGLGSVGGGAISISPSPLLCPSVENLSMYSV